jgi:protein-disulfide isomerase
MKYRCLLSVATTLALTFSSSFAVDLANKDDKLGKAKIVNSSSIELKKSLGQESVYSAGAKYLENIIKKNDNVQDVTVEEIYTKKISDDWKGGIFNVSIEDIEDNKSSDIVKLFYNGGGLVVLDIFTTDGRSMIQQLSLPLSKEIAYNKEFLVFNRDVSKKSPKGKNMVIFSDPQCPYCMQRIPEVLDFAKTNNMNVYYYDVPLPIPEHANSKEIAMCLHTAIQKNKDDAIKIIKNAYGYDFGSMKKSLDEVIGEFNKISGVYPISKKDVTNFNAKQHLEESVNIVDTLHINQTPTVYVDGKKL